MPRKAILLLFIIVKVFRQFQTHLISQFERFVGVASLINRTTTKTFCHLLFSEQPFVWYFHRSVFKIGI